MSGRNYYCWICSLLFIVASCKKDENPKSLSVWDKQIAALSHTWHCTSATLNGVSQSGYSSFQIVMPGTQHLNDSTFGYFCNNRPIGTKSSPWPATGAFTFGTDPTTQLTRDDYALITYSVSITQLTFTFNYLGVGYDGRAGDVVGIWVFTFGL